MSEQDLSEPERRGCAPESIRSPHDPVVLGPRVLSIDPRVASDTVRRTRAILKSLQAAQDKGKA